MKHAEFFEQAERIVAAKLTDAPKQNHRGQWIHCTRFEGVPSCQLLEPENDRMAVELARRCTKTIRGQSHYQKLMQQRLRTRKPGKRP